MKIGNIIAIMMILTVTITMFALPLTNAHDPPWTIKTFSYCSVSPGTIGMGQTALVVMFLDKTPPTAYNEWGDRWIFNLVVTKPDGTNETIGPLSSDAVGSRGQYYTPDQVGTYRFIAIHPDQALTGKPFGPEGNYVAVGPSRSPTSVNDTYATSTSEPAYLVVQEQPIQGWVESPLPTEYWTRPVNSMNRDWWPLVSNWLAAPSQTKGSTTNFAYGPGTETSHVLWRTPYWDGGLTDARFGTAEAMWIGREYEGFGLLPPVIIDGKIYYNNVVPPRFGIVCLDLYTGEEIVENFRNTTTTSSVSAGRLGSEGATGRIAFGSVMNYHSMNMHGDIPYLWVTATGKTNVWDAYNPYNNMYVFSIGNVSASGTAAVDSIGSILRYNIVGTGANKRLTVWNTTRCGVALDAITDDARWLRGGGNAGDSKYGLTIDGSAGFSLNISIPDVQGSIRAVVVDDQIIGGTTGSNDGTTIVQGNLWSLNLNQTNGIVGSLKWNITFTPPSTQAGDVSQSLTGVYPEYDVFAFHCVQLRQRNVYSLSTGQLLWTSNSESPWQYYGMNTKVYQGLLMSYGMEGQLIAYNIKTGDIAWTYNATTIGREAPYPNYPLSGGLIADGKLYLHSSEHSPTQPFWRGSYIRCINVSNGQELWKVAHWADGYLGEECMAMADGILVSLNLYDTQIYGYGKGPSATTVSIQNDVTTLGNSVLVKGSVNDVSPGTEQLQLEKRFTNGVPAVADESMGAWMEYLYAQQIKPSDAKGVEVIISVLDSNNNFYEVGRTTSDASGTYSAMFTPQVPGKYTVFATFAGSKAYYGSFAETAVGVQEAPPTPVPSEAPLTLPPTEMYFAASTIAIILAIAIVGFLVLRKHP